MRPGQTLLSAGADELPGRQSGHCVAPRRGHRNLSCSKIGFGLLTCGFAVVSGGSVVFIDQAVQYGFSVDSLDIEVDCGGAGSSVLTAGNPAGADCEASRRSGYTPLSGAASGRR